METAELERERMMEAEEVNSERTLTEQSDAASQAGLTAYLLLSSFSSSSRCCLSNSSLMKSNEKSHFYEGAFLSAHRITHWSTDLSITLITMD